jgi:hypothetical protein
MVKTYQVVLLPQAVKSLKQITDYLRRKESDQVATYVRKHILANIKQLRACWDFGLLVEN